MVPGASTKTSAHNCKIRGGMYSDSPLTLWLPKAEKGDVTAQAYVGEIFQRGLGVPPDYKKAAQWYERAAQGGSSSAANALGAMYEQGLGVPKDATQAAAWYGRASGGSARIDIVAAGISKPDTEELRRQQQQMQAELERTKRERDGLQQNLERVSAAAKADQAKLAELQKQAGESARTPKEIEQLTGAVQNLKGQLANKDRETERLQKDLVRMKEDMQTLQTQASRIETTIDEKDAGPEIVMIEPAEFIVATRDIVVSRNSKIVRVPAGAPHLAMVGRVDASAGVFSFTVNGREEKLDGKLFKTQVPIRKPEEPVHMVAIDRAGRRNMLDFVILQRDDTPPPSDRPGVPLKDAKQLATFRATLGNYYALVIGNNEYPKITPLKTAVNDAQVVASVLQNDYGFRVTLLRDAGRLAILNELEKLRMQLTEKDNLLIYYAGHGWQEPITKRGYWLPVDAEETSRANMISTIDISDIVATMKVKQLLVVADSCFSGGLIHTRSARLVGGTEEELNRIRELAQKNSRMVMTSAGLGPAVDGSGPHSIFAGPFIELLRTNAGAMQGQEMFKRLSPEVVLAATKVHIRQTPEYGALPTSGADGNAAHQGGDFVFLKVNAN